MELQNMTTETDAAAQALLASLTAIDEAENQTAPAVPDFDLANDEAALLADLELATAAETETALAQIEVTADTELDDEALAELDSDVKRAEVYSTQSAGAPVATPEEAAAVQKATKRAKSTTPKTASTPRKNLTDLPDDAFQMLDTAPADRADVMSRRPGQVKVAEKFDNLLTSLDAGKLPSRYVVTAAKLLNKTGSMTNADLIGAYIAEGLGKGTAASQSGQIMVLFSALGVALRSGQALTKIPDSTIARKLNDVIAKHTATA